LQAEHEPPWYGTVCPVVWEDGGGNPASYPMCARQGAPTWGLKSPTGPAAGTVSWTARVSTARWNLKEAAGKSLARRTETAYEAAMPDEKSDIFKVR